MHLFLLIHTNAQDYVTIANSPDDLLIQLPVFFRLENQKPLELHSVQTVPVPMDTDTTEGKANKFTKIIPEYPCIAINSEQHFPILAHTVETWYKKLA